ncbi:MAG: tetratricopeptide repeat protein [Rhodocyclaceae bacterium]|nr:tetratricopeptide repeat protein [Rhodocyclaceae bacterium]
MFPLLRILMVSLFVCLNGATVAQEAAPTAKLPPQELTPQLLYQTVLAEIAAARGQMDVASAAYVDLAKTTRDPRIARRAAEVAFHARIPTAALEAARLWLELEPESPQARQYLWALLASTGKVDELADTLSGALKAEPDIAAALLQLNRLLGRSPDKPMVLRLIDKVTTPYLSLPEARFTRAQAAAAAKDEMRAMAELDELMKLRPDWAPGVMFKAQLLLRTPEKALDILDAYLKRQPAPTGDNANLRQMRARLLVELKRYEEAQQAFSALLAEQPDNADLLYALGLLALQLGDGAAAEKHLRPLLAMGYAEADNARYYLGQLAEDNGRVEEALGLYDAIPEKSARYAAAQARAASLLKNIGQLEEALTRLRKAAEADKEMRSALLVAQAQLLAEAGRGGEAIELLSRALEAQPQDGVLLYELGMLEERAQKFEAMEGHFRKLIKLTPGNPQAYNALGYSLVERNLRLDEAAQLIDKGLALAPEDPFILDSKGWLLFRRGNLEGAENYLRRAYQKRPDPEIAAHLGEVLWLRDKRDEARQLWTDAAKQAPENATLAATIKRFIP